MVTDNQDDSSLLANLLLLPAIKLYPLSPTPAHEDCAQMTPVRFSSVGRAPRRTEKIHISLQPKYKQLKLTWICLLLRQSAMRRGADAFYSCRAHTGRTTSGESKNFKGGGVKDKYQPRRNLSQIQTTNYMPFIRKQGGLLIKNLSQ